MTFSMSLSSFEASVQGWFVETEAEVLVVITKIQQGVANLETQIDQALTWVVNNTPAIVTDIESVINFVGVIGAGSNPEVAVAVTAAQAAIVALNAVANAKNTGASDAATLLAGYKAVQQATAAAASAKAAATSVVAAAA